MTAGRSPMAVLFTFAVIALSMVHATNSLYETLVKNFSPDGFCLGDYDVVVILDRSSQVDQATFNQYIELTKNLVDLFDIQEGGNHFGLVHFNNNPEVAMKLNENNNAAFIENYLMTDLPGRQGGRNIQRALRETRQELLTEVMGDRPEATNVCLVLTPAFDVRDNNQFPKIKEVCDQIMVLRMGDDADLQDVREKVCPAVSDEEAKNRTIEFCTGLFECNNTYYNNLVDSCKDENKTVCPFPYAASGGYCFHIQLIFRTFYESLAECEDRNGTLVRVDTPEKNAAVVGYTDALDIPYDNRNLWIGLTDETGDNDDWHWVSDGSALTFDFWDPSQPNDDEQQCVFMGATNDAGGANGLWFDTYCDNYYGAICEAEPIH